MREIKFRLIKDNKIVGYEMWLDDKWVYRLPEQELFSLYTPFISHDKKDYYTGLKDKNGVDIYDGDILARCFDDYDEHCEVFYDYAICSVRTLKSKSVRPLNIKANKNGCGWCNVDGGSSCYDFRVICNIYENHELLEQIKCGS